MRVASRRLTKPLASGRTAVSRRRQPEPQPERAELTLRAKVVRAGRQWTWQVSAQDPTSRRPRKIYTDPHTYESPEAALSAARTALAGAVSVSALLESLRQESARRQQVTEERPAPASGEVA